MIYGDFECLINDTKEHVPCGFAYRLVSNDPRQRSFSSVYRGEDAVEKFLEETLAVGNKLVDLQNEVVRHIVIYIFINLTLLLNDLK